MESPFWSAVICGGVIWFVGLCIEVNREILPVKIKDFIGEHMYIPPVAIIVVTYVIFKIVEHIQWKQYMKYRVEDRDSPINVRIVD